MRWRCCDCRKMYTTFSFAARRFFSRMSSSRQRKKHCSVAPLLNFLQQCPFCHLHFGQMSPCRLHAMSNNNNNSNSAIQFRISGCNRVIKCKHTSITRIWSRSSNLEYSLHLWWHRHTNYKNWLLERYMGDCSFAPSVLHCKQHSHRLVRTIGKIMQLLLLVVILTSRRRIRRKQRTVTHKYLKIRRVQEVW